MRLVVVLGLSVALVGCKSLLGIESGTVGDAAIDTIDDTGAPVWWDAAFRSRRSITLDARELSLPLVDIPVLVRLPPPVASELLANAADLRFVTGDHATLLAFEIEPDGAGLVCWVKLSITEVNQRFWMYYGRADAPPATNSAKVFGDDYVSVSHLDSTADATGHGHDGQAPPASTPTTIAGVVGNARSFDGIDDYLALADGDGPYAFTTEMSASMWILVSAFTNSYQAILAKGDGTWRVQREIAGQILTFSTSSPSGNDNVLSTSGVADDRWHHIVAVREPTKKTLYIDGVQESAHNVSEAINLDSKPVTIGYNEEFPARAWDGAIDEVRISASARSAAWVKAEYTMVTGAQFVTIGPRETQ